MCRRERNRFLPHLERFLGPYRGGGVAEPEWNVPFSVLRWRDVPEANVDVTASLGLGRHLFEARRQEILIALRREWEDVALSIIVTVGAYLIDRHLPLNVGETVRVPSELETPAEILAVASADELINGLGRCSAYEPPIEILYLAPQTEPDRFDLTSG